MIRFLNTADLPHVYEIVSYWIEHSTANMCYTPILYDIFAKEQLAIAQDYPYLVAEYEGRVIGFGYAHGFIAREAYQYDAELTIYFQEGPHHGLVMPLYQALESICLEMGFCNLISCTTADNQASLAFQKRVGFQTYGLLEKAAYKNGAWHGVEWLYKPIGSYQNPKRFTLQEVLATQDLEAFLSQREK